MRGLIIIIILLVGGGGLFSEFYGIMSNACTTEHRLIATPAQYG